MTTRPKRERAPRKTPAPAKPKPRQLNAAQITKHRAMVAKKHDQEQLIADAQVIEAEFRAYSLRLQRELGLKADEIVNEDGEITKSE